MSIIEKIKSALGLGGSSEAEGTDVTVERETDEPAAAGTDAAGSTESITEKPSEDPETAAEPGEAGAGVTEHSGTDTAAAEPAEAAGPVPDEPESEVDVEEDELAEDDEAETDAEAEGDDEAETDAEDGQNAPVDSVSGIGPAYADRLADIGVETVAELLEADASELAEATDLSEKRIRRWQERAEEL